MLLALLAHPNIASKHWIIRQYDHEVQGQTVIKPLTGVRDDGPSDAAVLTPKLDSARGLAFANGLVTGLAADPYLMALAAIDECVRNLVCVGTDPTRIAILDNFCWPSCGKAENLGSLVRAAQGCYDGAKAYRTPFISGKDSLNNQFTTEDGTTIRIPPTLLISGMGIVHDISKCITMDAKQPGSVVVLVGTAQPTFRGSHYEMLFGGGDGALPRVDLVVGPAAARAVANAISTGLVHAAHDVSDGGLLVAIAEMCFAGGLGFVAHGSFTEHDWFSESPSRFLLEVFPDDLDALKKTFGEVPFAIVGRLNVVPKLIVPGALEIDVNELLETWLKPLDW
jgi:phosphoribosylformylglycinamidine synthase